MERLNDMGNKKKKYYVVWAGHQPGIYQTWAECKTHTEGFPSAEFKSFKTLEEAETGLQERELIDPQSRPNNNSYCVDAACSGNPGPLEYRGVNTATREEIFKQGPFENGTNNIGEFLAVVHALALFKNKGIQQPIYSDSVVAIGWINKKHCKTTIEQDESNQKLFELMTRAEQWLNTNTYVNKILKWHTHLWGEIPADFGRK